MNKIDYVYQTREYEKFRKLKGNRNVLEARKNLIVSSIKERGWIRNPITVNEEMEIIDGQGRFEALQELGLPIEYVISVGATIKDCIALNVKQKNWSNMDYIRSYAENGFDDYITLLSAIQKYPEMNVSSITTIAGYSSTDGAGVGDPIKSGTFHIHNKDCLDDRLSFCLKALSIIGKGNGRERTWSTCLKFIYECGVIDNILFLEKLEKRRAFIYPVVNTKQAIECMESIINYGVRKKIYLHPEYDAWLHSTRTEKFRRTRNERRTEAE